ncbi:MAG: hypothetical protein HY563_07415 [Ignavibacteriales bacterium]|nr:hypothetical protein [Ignavibacteriales bacterium]
MAKVILQIAYEIDPDRRKEYLDLAAEMKSHFRDTMKKDYSLFEVKGKKNSFLEQYVCTSMEEYEALEDDLDEKASELINRLEALLKNGRARYTTLVEAE